MKYRCVIYARPVSGGSGEGGKVCGGSCIPVRCGSWLWFWCWFGGVGDLIKCLEDVVRVGFSPVALGFLSGDVRVLPYARLKVAELTSFFRGETFLSDVVEGLVCVEERFSLGGLMPLVQETASRIRVVVNRRGVKRVWLTLRKELPIHILYDLGIRAVKPLRIPPNPPPSV